MDSSINVIEHPHFSTGEQNDMHREALKRIAEEAGFVFEGRASVSRWLQHLADKKIREEGIGYYAVRTMRDGERCLVFLDQRPVQDVRLRVVFVECDGVQAPWGHGVYVKLVSEDGARWMLREYGVKIEDSEPVLRDTYYAVQADEAVGWSAVDVAPDRGLHGKLVRCRFGRLLERKRRRDKRGWQLAEVCRETDIWPATIGKYARDEVTQYSLETLDRLSKFLGCKVGELLVIEEEGEL